MPSPCPFLVLTEHPGDTVSGTPIMLDQVGISHVSFTVPNVEEVTQRLLAHGPKPTGQPMHFAMRMGTFAQCFSATRMASWCSSTKAGKARCPFRNPVPSWERRAPARLQKPRWSVAVPGSTLENWSRCMKQTSSVKKAARKARADAFSPGNLESESHRTPLGVAAPRGAGQASSSLQCSSAAALWPLVQAAQSTGMLPVALALGNVAAGVGGNLIAEQIQRWHDQAHLPLRSRRRHMDHDPHHHERRSPPDTRHHPGTVAGDSYTPSPMRRYTTARSDSLSEFAALRAAGVI